MVILGRGGMCIEPTSAVVLKALDHLEAAHMIQAHEQVVQVVYDPAKVSGNPFQRQFCGGSLIDAGQGQGWVLTAAPCVPGTAR
jgi:hypothetical protein